MKWFYGDLAEEGYDQTADKTGDAAKNQVPDQMEEALLEGRVFVFL